MTAQKLFEVLAKRQETLAFCESLTAGLAAATFAGIPGASQVLKGGLVTYATTVKAHFLGTTVEKLESQKVVSAATAKEMAQAAVKHCDSTWGISLTGVAGPDLQEDQPPGTVFMGIAHQQGFVNAYKLQNLSGGRQEIREGACEQAFSLLLDILEGREDFEMVTGSRKIAVAGTKTT